LFSSLFLLSFDKSITGRVHRFGGAGGRNASGISMGASPRSRNAALTPVHV
jgi:hypothetical protein